MSLADRLRPLVEGAVAARSSSRNSRTWNAALLGVLAEAARSWSGRAGAAVEALRDHPEAGPLTGAAGGVAASARAADAGGRGRPARPVPRLPARCARSRGGIVNLKDVPLLWPQFAYPDVLYVLVVPVLLLVLVWSNRWLLPAGGWCCRSTTLAARGGWWWWAVLGLAESVPALLLATGIVLLAGPAAQRPAPAEAVADEHRVRVDVSGSMTAPFGEGTRYDASMKAIDEFLDYRKGDAFGLTFFGNTVLHWVPLTTDPSAHQVLAAVHEARRSRRRRSAALPSPRRSWRARRS